MNRLLTIASGIDRFTSAIGRGVSWLALVMILVGAYNALARYLGRFVDWRLSSNLYLELQWYLFSVLFLLAAAWALKEDAHVRVDVIYSRSSRRARAWIDLLGGLLMLLPFCVFTFIVSVPSVRSSWAIREGSPDPGGLPRYPLKAIVLLALALLALQGLAQTIRSVASLRGEESSSVAEQESPDER